MEEYKEYQPPLARFRRLRSFLTDSSSRQDPEEVDYNKRNGIPETPASLGTGSPNTPTNAEGEDQGPPPVPKYNTPMPKPAAIATIEGRGNSPSRYIESWKMWRENHNPLNAFTLFALRQYLAELVGTALFVFAGTGSVVGLQAKDGLDSAGSNVAIALAFGFGIAAMVYATANVSGGHLNPAVTIAMMVTSNKNLTKGLFYIISQMIGAIIGSGLLAAATRKDDWGPVDLGITKLGDGISQARGFLMEAIITFMLVFTVFGTVKMDLSSTSMGRLAGLSIGLSVIMGHFVALSFTGASMNPARTFGPAVISGYWEDHWVYWVGPIVGGVLAGLLFQFILQPEHHEPSPENQVRRDVIENNKIMEKAREEEGPIPETDEEKKEVRGEESPSSGEGDKSQDNQKKMKREYSVDSINHDSGLPY